MQRYQHQSMAAAAQLPSSPKVITAPYKMPYLSSQQQQQLNLPPSIPLSLDGEEGAKAYTQHLLQSNIDFKPECYQAPPNRTIQHRLSDETDLFGHQDMRRAKSSLANYKTHSLALTSPKVQARKGALPAVPYQAQMTPYAADSDTGDYVSSSLLSSWRSMSSDRTAGREFASIPVTGKQQPQQRSSSADSVKRIVKRFFSKKLGIRVLSLKTETHSSSEHGLFDTFDELPSGAIAASAGSYKPDHEAADDSRWDLPPNYVDMIFTKDPITNESQSDVIDDESSSKCGSFN